MRWLCHDPGNAMESAARNEMLLRIDAWWKAFEAKIDDIEALFKQSAEWDLPGWMADTLQRISPELMWEYGRAVKGEGYRLVITPESRHHLRALVSTVLERAPAFPGWEFYPQRLSESMDDAQMAVEARTGGSLDSVKFRAAIGEFNRIDITCYLPSCVEPDDQLSMNIAFVALESLLGEEWLNLWVGGIRTMPLPGKKSWLSRFMKSEADHLVPLERLHSTIASLIDSIQSQLPARPWMEYETQKDGSIGPNGEPPQWSLIKLKPVPGQSDYEGKTDLLTGVTVDVSIWTAAHRSPAFYSSQFSRHGETFCYLKLDGRPGDSVSDFEDRASIEDAIESALVAEKVGCTIGGGTGLFYSYVDLALIDVQKAIPVIRSVLQKGRIEKRGWLLFFDVHLSQEWVGVYDDTPEPLLPSIE